MDRRSRALLTATTSLVLALLIAGCASVPGTTAGESRPASSQPQDIFPGAAGSETFTGQPQPTADPFSRVPAEPMGSQQTPEAGGFPEISIQAPARDSQRALDGDRAAQSGRLSDEFHLSADTGWLVLPEPRITDDLPVIMPDAAAWIDGADDVVLILPRVPSGVPAVETPPKAVLDPNSRASAPSAGLVTPGLTAGETPLPRPGSAAVSVSADESSLVQGPANPVGLQAQLETEPDPVFVPESGGPGSQTETPVAPMPGIEPEGWQGLPPVRETFAGGASSSAGVNESGVQSSRDWLRRAASVTPESDVFITMPGSGWIYVGREFGTGTANLVEKRSVLGDDQFVFRFSQPGDYRLWFQREDPQSGDLANERLEVTAIPGGSTHVSVGTLDAEMSVSLPGASAPSSGSTALVAGVTAPTTGSTPLFAGATAPVGDLVESLAGTESPVAAPASAVASAEGPEEWMVRARNAMASGNARVAAEYWGMVSSAGGADASVARQHLFNLAVESSHPELLIDAVDALRDARELEADELLVAADVAEGSGDLGRAAAYYEELTGFQNSDVSVDELWFRLAQILEKPGDARDLPRALDLYERLLDEYPLSRLWDDASTRIEFLNRHYFEVR